MVFFYGSKTYVFCAGFCHGPVMNTLDENASVSETNSASEKVTPCFLEPVFPQELEKPGFSFA